MVFNTLRADGREKLFFWVTPTLCLALSAPLDEQDRVGLRAVLGQRALQRVFTATLTYTHLFLLHQHMVEQFRALKKDHHYTRTHTHFHLLQTCFLKVGMVT